jgi:hypothetical protein
MASFQVSMTAISAAMIGNWNVGSVFPLPRPAWQRSVFATLMPRQSM